MKAPHPPIFLIEGEDVGIFTSVQRAENHIEPADVDVGEAFDARGQRLRVTTDGVRTFIDLAEKDASDLSYFERVLRQYLTAIGEKRADQQACDFNCLIEIARRHALR